MSVWDSVDRAAIGSKFLLVTVRARVCALPVQHCAEVMRPLRVEPVAGAPHYVRGLSVIRGAPVPVVDMSALLDGPANSTSCGRFVAMKIDERRFALAVDGVIGIHELEAALLDALPPLLRHAESDLIEAIGAADAQLLLVLRGARLLPEEVWNAIETGAVPQ